MIVFIKPIKFAILFTLGNLLAVGSTAFLIGPAQQINMMFDSARIYATAVYLGCVVIALICALLELLRIELVLDIARVKIGQDSLPKDASSTRIRRIKFETGQDSQEVLSEESQII
ncbi:hypothetical protein Q3G72_029209 [Acer saccharum]|nr:hypothetical protein Q3G72_029209 [Acer saccharum]